MARSLKKGPIINAPLHKRVMKAKAENSKRPIRTYARSATVIPDMVGLTISVYNGKNWINVFISEDLVGHKLGEFSPSRQFRSHAGNG